MSTNLTIDDSSLDIIYSSDWAPQSSSLDPNTDLFFQSTYHSAQGDGAYANLTFTGSAIYLYGSKGPEHANYSVQFDNYIIFYSAVETVTHYQQPLFAYTFNTSGVHFVSLTSHHTTTNKWLDLDYITITVNASDSNATSVSTSASASTPTASQTISPPWLLESASSSARPSSLSTTEPMPSSSASSSTSRLTLILTIAFGAIILAALIFGLGCFIARRGKRRRDDQKPNQMALRVETPGPGAFAYKPPPSPSFFGGPMSPASADMYSTHSPASRTDPFHRVPSLGPEHDTLVNVQHGPGHSAPGREADGRRSPHSTLSGGATVLTAASTAHLLNPHSHSAGEPARKQFDSAPEAGAGSRVRKMRNPLPQFRKSTDLPIYKHHRTFDSETGINMLKGRGALRSTQAVAEKTETHTGDVLDLHSQEETQLRDHALPLPPLHAAHRSESTLDSGAHTIPAAPPQRPKRPGDGLLDFFGDRLAHKLERNANAKRRRDDADSERTNFLKV